MPFFKKNKSLFINITLGFIVFVVFVITFGVYKYYKFNENKCEKMIGIAKDDRKITYIRNWALSNIDNKKLNKHLLKRKSIYARQNFDIFNTINFDWEYIGLDKKNAYMSLHGVMDNKINLIDLNKIKSITVGEGRYGLSVKLEEKTKPGIIKKRKKDHTNNVIRINDSVDVYCQY